MKITKLGHCCMLVEEKGVRILTDPGMFTVEAHEALTAIDIILITHEHADHLHTSSLRNILAKNAKAKVFCNKSVGAILSGENIEHTVMTDGARVEEKEVVIEGFGTTHATIHASLPESMNTGYFIANTLWYPGDAFTDPKRTVDILALPIAGPWMKMSEALEYAIALKPRVAFPVHDGILNPALLNMNAFPYRVPSTVLEPRGIRFVPLEINTEYEL